MLIIGEQSCMYMAKGPLLYKEKEIDAVETHIEKYFGHSESVFHEIVSPDLHIDLYIIEPTPERDYYTMVTVGAGAYVMNVPEGYEGPKRIEVLVNLPKDWDIKDDNEKNYWPLRWLKILARLPMDEDSWLGWGHTITNEGPFAKNTKLSGILLLEPSFHEDSAVAELPNKDEVLFLQMMPIYEEEMEFKINNDAESLLELFEEIPSIVDIKRQNVMKKERKPFFKRK